MLCSHHIESYLYKQFILLFKHVLLFDVSTLQEHTYCKNGIVQLKIHTAQWKI